MTLSRSCLCAALLLAGGCSPTFRPLEASGRAPANMAAADYSLADETAHMGAAQVWLEEPAGDDRRVRLGLRLRNEGASPLRLDLDDTELEVRTGEGKLYVIAEIQALTGDEVVPPRTTGRAHLDFLLPAELAMDDLVGFELVWAVVGEDGTRVTNSTTFVRESWRDARARSYYNPY